MNRAIYTLLSMSHNIQSGMNMAKEEFTSIWRFLINYIAVPIISAVVLGILLFNIAKAVAQHRQQMEYSDRIKPIIICIIVLTLVASFPMWGWTMIGGSSLTILPVWMG